MKKYRYGEANLTMKKRLNSPISDKNTNSGATKDAQMSMLYYIWEKEISEKKEFEKFFKG